ncbi:MAG: hypothetical protein AB7K04_04130 [Pseudorhodoplanes sp.]
MRRLPLIALALVGFALAGCADFDMPDFFGSKKPLPGERKLVFPEGVPGVTQGIPPEYRKGAHQQMMDAQAAAAAPEAEAKPEPPPKPKPKPKPRRAAAPPPSQPSPNQPAPRAQQGNAAPAWPSAPQQPQQQQAPASPAWPAAPAQSAQPRWPGTTSN